MYQIKQIPEDFIVNELNSVKTGTGDYSYFVMKKKDYTTQASIERIADFLHIPLKYIGYAGTKDRRAITTQMISIKANAANLNQFKHPFIELEFKGNGPEPISLGDLDGNAFEIIVRNITEVPEKIAYFVNYFDEQRFSNHNAAIGKLLVKKEFKKAVELILENDGDYEQKVRDAYEETNDAVNSMRKIPMKILKLYVHAYQSLLWNEIAKEMSQKTKENLELPLIGFGTDIKEKEVRLIAEKIMGREGITYRDFIIKSIPDLSSEGVTRMLYADIRDLKFGKLENDELNKGMKKIKITFSLDKGNYATMAIKNLFKESI